MFKAVRISILLFILFFVAVSTWLTQARSTDWNNSLWVKVYPINADGSDEASRFIDNLQMSDFEGIEAFIARETERYSRDISRPVRIELGTLVREQPPETPNELNMFSVMIWSLKMRWWSGSVTDNQDKIDPDVRIFVRYHRPDHPQRRRSRALGVEQGQGPGRWNRSVDPERGDDRCLEERGGARAAAAERTG